MKRLWQAIRYNIKRVMDSDPAADSVWMVLWTYPHITALFWHFFAHRLYKRGYKRLSRRIVLHSRRVTGFEGHPGATIGRGLFIDHGMGVVIGETAIVGDDVTLFHGVTLGGMSSKKVKRHPTVGNDVLIGAGTKVLGDITVGDHSRIGCNLVIKRDVPANVVIYETEPENVVSRRHKPTIHLIDGNGHSNQNQREGHSETGRHVPRHRIAFTPKNMTKEMAWYI